MQPSHPKKPRAAPSRSHAGLKPLDATRLEALALAYVARFATSAARLESYLLRKARAASIRRDGESCDENGMEEMELRGAVAALVTRFATAGYIDDEAFAGARSSGLQRRGFGRRRIAQDLGHSGIAADIVAGVLPGDQAERLAALALARKRRLGPFGPAVAERALREKQIAILLRAGHRLDSARELVNAVSIEAAESWACGDDQESE